MNRNLSELTVTVIIETDDDAVAAAKDRLRDVCRKHFRSEGCSGADLERTASAKPRKGHATFEVECDCGWEYSLQARGLLDMRIEGPGRFGI